MLRRARLTTWAVGSVTSLSHQAPDTEVATIVNGGRVESRLTLHLTIEGGEVGLIEDFLNFLWVGIDVQDGRQEITAETRRAVLLADVDMEVEVP